MSEVLANGRFGSGSQLRRRLLGLPVLVMCLMAQAASAIAASVEYGDDLRVVRLSGSPYDIGRQHGEALRQEVQASVATVLGYFRRYLKIPLVRSWAANWWVDRPWRSAQRFVAPDYLEELRGLADTSGVPLRELYRLHAIPDRTYSCANFVAWGLATSGGRLVHARNLDWNIGAGIQRFATVFVVRPEDKRAFINLGWAGFIGVLSGVNEARLSVGQIGAETVEATFSGEPMVFVLRRILETSRDLDDAAALVAGARRTVGVNYVLADATARRGVILETTHRHIRRFEADDPAEHRVRYARPIADAVLRADTAMDPAIRDRQRASRGDPTRAGLEDPSGSSAYDVRYLGQAAGILAHYGAIDAQTARLIAQAVAPDSNVQSVVFAWPEVWVANAQGAIPAARTTYHRLDAERLLELPRESRR